MCLAQGSTSNGTCPPLVCSLFVYTCRRLIDLSLLIAGTFTVGSLDKRIYTGDMSWAPNVGGGLCVLTI